LIDRLCETESDEQIEAVRGRPETRKPARSGFSLDVIAGDNPEMGPPDDFQGMRTIESQDPFARASATRSANRRRLRSFLSVFIAALAIGLTWDFLRPAEYRATARLQITPASGSPLAEAQTTSSAPDANLPFLTELQALSSRPLIEQVSHRLREAGHDLSPFGPDPVLGLQSSLTVTPLPGTNVVELAAIGSRPELPAALLIGISEAYREEVARNYRDTTTEARARADEETAKLEAAVADKRRAVEDFRRRSNIVSPEREENDVLAEMQGLAKALKEANQRVAAAEGRAGATRESAAAGRSVVRSRDNPTLANLEQRASQTRADLRDLERVFTPDYLAMDPQARVLRARLVELEQQIKAQRETGQQNALSEADEELASAREAARRLQSQVASRRQEVGAFAALFSQYKSLRDELGQLEKAYQDALRRKARLDATERSRMPAVHVLEQAALPREPWQPHYWRDAALVLAGSVLLGLLAVWLVELFNRPEPHPSVVIAQPIVTGQLLHGPHTLGVGQIRLSQLEEERPRLLARPQDMPRELSAQDMVSLVRAADPETRLAIALLLSGLSPEEAVALRGADVDLVRSVIELRGPPWRTVTLNGGLARLLSIRAAGAEEPILREVSGNAVSPDSLATQLLCAAHDGGIERVDEVTPAALRHTYIAFLVRQGARFADLAQWVGPLPAETLSAYSALAPTGARLAAESVNRNFPGIDTL
jgi:polysaccharide biosynthesis transport protein